jgi:hypothetical protein
VSAVATATLRPRKRAQAVPIEPIALCCDICGADAIAAEPGTEETYELFLLARGAPLRRWCAAHWPWLASEGAAA